MRRNNPVCLKCDSSFPNVFRPKPAEAPTVCTFPPLDCKLSQAHTWPSIVIRSSGSRSESCLFVCPSAAGLIPSTNDSAGSSQMSDTSGAAAVQIPCFILLVSDDGALISFSFVSSSRTHCYSTVELRPATSSSRFPPL